MTAFLSEALMFTIADCLQTYLRTEWSDPGLVVGAIEPFGDGHSGFTYLVPITSEHRNGTFVLRLSPPNVRIAGPADVGRQGRIMAALAPQGIPVPGVLIADSRPQIDGRSFLLMERARGMSIGNGLLEATPAAIASAAVRVLHDLLTVPLQRTGISDEPSTGLVAELARWTKLMDRAPDSMISSARRLRELLAAQRPTEEPVGLVHGDYHYGNMLFDGASVTAVLDWEIASLGQPMLDFGCLCVSTLRRRFTSDPNPTGNIDVSVAELVEIYGAPPSVASWYVGLSCYKYTAILGYNLMLHRTGMRPDPIYEQLTTTMRGLLEDGIEIVGGGLDGR